MNTSEKRYLTPLQLSQELGISRSLAYQLLQEGRIAFIRIGGKGRRGRYLIDRDAITPFLDSCREDLADD